MQVALAAFLLALGTRQRRRAASVGKGKMADQGDSDSDGVKSTSITELESSRNDESDSSGTGNAPADLCVSIGRSKMKSNSCHEYRSKDKIIFTEVEVSCQVIEFDPKENCSDTWFPPSLRFVLQQVPTINELMAMITDDLEGDKFKKYSQFAFYQMAVEDLKENMPNSKLSLLTLAHTGWSGVVVDTY
ncbi:unnamed protein product [Miscanthus lutarioriparius]|uniref:Uncharacterized protein n=1 Tax=Miscanthus lutarioriparius TaxID=422564 RepID=A0A811MXA6_9POAL|nr:unnamed protein product [Miscanthus lutarioriparius]